MYVFLPHSVAANSGKMGYEIVKFSEMTFFKVPVTISVRLTSTLPGTCINLNVI
jgi:hypothetical protein